MSLQCKKVIFLGNMNNMPYTFAREIKKLGQPVTLLIDVSASYPLDRPESFDDRVTYPYDSWIKETRSSKLPSRVKMLKMLWPKLFYKKEIKELNSCDIIVLNGEWIKLGAYIAPQKKVIILFAGFDLEVSADYGKLPHFVTSFLNRHKSLFFFKPLIILAYKKLITLQRRGIYRADKVNYYISGINEEGDNLLKEILNGKPAERQEVRGFPVDNFPYISPSKSPRLRILNFTRFFFKNAERADNKRNDIMIEGIAKFIKINNLLPENVSILFIEKGADLLEAKKLISELKIEDYITWKKPILQKELNEIIINSDIVFDQLGQHWLGYGIVAMLYGRAVIANGRLHLYKKAVGEAPPLCHAENASDVCRWLTELYYNREKLIEIGIKSHDYIARYYDIKNNVDFILN
jgi:hypothetical protein